MEDFDLRRNGVHSDSPETLLLCYCARDPNDRMLAGHVRHVAAQAHEAGETAGVDDGARVDARAALPHVRQFCAQQVDRALDVDVEDEVDLCVASLAAVRCWGLGRRHNAREVGRPVDRPPAKVRHSGGDPGAARCLGSDVNHGRESGRTCRWPATCSLFIDLDLQGTQAFFVNV